MLLGSMCSRGRRRVSYGSLVAGLHVCKEKKYYSMFVFVFSFMSRIQQHEFDDISYLTTE
jgi:hypothetical protein